MSVKQHGQLQPTGVRQGKREKENGGTATEYRLIFGASRLAAIILLEKEGLEPNVTVLTVCHAIGRSAIVAG